MLKSALFEHPKVRTCGWWKIGAIWSWFCVYFSGQKKFFPGGPVSKKFFSSQWMQNTILTPNLQRGVIFSIFELRMAVLRVHRGASGPSGPWPSPAGRWPPSRLPPPGTQNGHSELIGAPQTRCDPSLESELKSASIVAGISQKPENRFSKKYVRCSKVHFLSTLR